ncbi:MAG: SRPBCC domain-containing protein [Umezawaea sp.]
MSDQSFTTTFSVDRTPREVFDAVVDVRGWWSEDIDGGTAEAGDEFEYRNGDVHTCKVRITEVVPDRRVSWLVLENHFDFTADQTEWAGTTVDFDIAEVDGRTELRFTHGGLVPVHECYDVCSTAWGFYVGDSLRELVTTGAGQPNAAGRTTLGAGASAGQPAAQEVP